MKKLLSILFCLSLFFSLVGCSSGTAEKDSPEKEQQDEKTESNEKTESDETSEEPNVTAETYTVGDTISTETLEMTFTESGVSEDIRYTSTESGIQITSGPSVLEGKKYVFLKGELKNLSKKQLEVTMGGTVDVDGYAYDLGVDTIQTTGSPTYRIDPLETMIILLYAAVPNELADDFDNATIIFGFNENFEASSLLEAQYLYAAPIKK